GQGSVVRGQWSGVSGQGSGVSGQWSGASGRGRIRFHRKRHGSWVILSDGLVELTSHAMISCRKLNRALKTGIRWPKTCPR
ncbi:MAG: hypothetical protein FJ135_12645, partial [Deltaproteobacteria bacterium]|nr:hypothetical protein [Deltaproteobacteria bacterium]